MATVIFTIIHGFVCVKYTRKVRKLTFYTKINNRFEGYTTDGLCFCNHEFARMDTNFSVRMVICENLCELVVKDSLVVAKSLFLFSLFSFLVLGLACVLLLYNIR